MFTPYLYRSFPRNVGSKPSFYSPSVIASLRSPLSHSRSFTVPTERQGETWKHQESLEHLPIPKISDTCAKFKQYIAPLLTKKELEVTMENISWFEKSNASKQLQEELEDLNQLSYSNWLEGFWDTMYLEQRSTLVVNTSPFFVLSDPPYPAYSKPALAQVERAASLTYSILKWNCLLYSKLLEPDYEGKKPLCMAQYAKLLGTARIPRLGRDEIVSTRHSRHIVVLRNGYIFKIEVEDEQWRFPSKSSLESLFTEVIELAEKAVPEDVGYTTEAQEAGGIPILTSENRDTWATCRKQLIQMDKNNRSNLDAIASALIVICLDKQSPSLEEFSKLSLHSESGFNRWFDKLQLIVTENGKASVCMEHAPIDGHTALRLMTDIVLDSTNEKPLPFISLNPAQPEEEVPLDQLTDAHFMEPQRPSLLKWTISPELESAIVTAKANVKKIIDRTHSSVLTFQDFGKGEIKTVGVSPDAFVQMGFQLAYYRAFHNIVSTYESALTKQFLHGRTETIRSVSKESTDWCKFYTQLEQKYGPDFLEKESVSPDELSSAADLLRKAAHRHTITAKEAKSGRGVDRHLFVLYNLAKHFQQRLPNYKIPDIFTDPAYAKYCSNILSTSNCGSDALDLFGFGPVHEEGLGVGYIIKDKSLSFNTTSFDSPAASTFNNSLENSLNQQLRLLKAAKPTSSAGS